MGIHHDAYSIQRPQSARAEHFAGRHGHVEDRLARTRAITKYGDGDARESAWSLSSSSKRVEDLRDSPVPTMLAIGMHVMLDDAAMPEHRREFAKLGPT